MKRRPPAYIFVSPVSFPAMKELQQLLPQPPEVALLHPRSILDALSAIDKSGRAVLLISAAEAKHLKLATTLASRLKPQIKAGLVKIAVLSEVEHDDLPKLLKKHGIEEVISHELKAKGIKHKLARLMSLVELAWEKSGKGRHDPDDKEAESAGAPGGESSAAPRDKKKVQVKAVAPLKTPDDCWIIRGKAFKRVQNMWILQVHGPSPTSGRWVKAGDKADSWVWVPKDPVKNPFVSEGAWTFYGRQPENKDKVWSFVGFEPRLTYSQDSVDICHRFECPADGILRVARNSRAALKKSALIASSYEQDMRTRKPAAPAPSAIPDLGGATLDFGDSEAAVEAEDSAIGPPAPPFADGRFGSKTVLEVERLSFYEEIMDELGPREEMFHVISKRKDCLALFRESAHLHAPAIIWTRGQKFRTNTKISHFAKDSGSIGIQLPTDYDWPKLMKSLQHVQAQEIFVNANLGRTAIFFRQPMSELRGGATAVEVTCPEKIYEVQRRRHFRHQLRAGEDAQACIVLDDGVSTYWKLMDISAGGACVSREAAPGGVVSKLLRGAKISSISFKIYGNEIECAGRVAWVKRKRGKSANEDVRVGIQFDHITHADREGIKLYVMEENYSYLKNNMARLSEED